jgi:hypothetical protein
VISFVSYRTSIGTLNFGSREPGPIYLERPRYRSALSNVPADGLPPGRPLLKLFPLLRGVAFAVDLRLRGADGDPRIRHAHHLISDEIRLILQRLIYRTDFELALNWTREMRRRSRR